MAKVYGVPPPLLQIDRISRYQDSIIYMREAILDTDVMEAVLAHEFAHYLFGHYGSSPSNGGGGGRESRRDPRAGPRL
jgi:hypothetical protein